MNYEIVTKEDLRLCGLSVELTHSQQENYRIIRLHWQDFNGKLRKKGLTGGRYWEKYGVTRKLGNRYLYLSAIPCRKEIAEFETLDVAGGTWACFRHVGGMTAIAATVYEIYTRTIPQSDLQIDLQRRLVHYERYDRRFHWNRSDSVLDICVPVENGDAPGFQG